MMGKYFLILSLLAVSHWMNGQEIRTDVKQCSLNFEGDSAVLSIDLAVTVSDMDARGSVELIPILQHEKQEKRMIPIVLNGKKRHRLYSRIQAMEMRKGLKPTAVYGVY